MSVCVHCSSDIKNKERQFHGLLFLLNRYIMHLLQGQNIRYSIEIYYNQPSGILHKLKIHH